MVRLSGRVEGEKRGFTEGIERDWLVRWAIAPKGCAKLEQVFGGVPVFRLESLRKDQLFHLGMSGNERRHAVCLEYTLFIRLGFWIYRMYRYMVYAVYNLQW